MYFTSAIKHVSCCATNNYTTCNCIMVALIPTITIHRPVASTSRNNLETVSTTSQLTTSLCHNPDTEMSYAKASLR